MLKSSFLKENLNANKNLVKSVKICNVCTYENIADLQYCEMCESKLPIVPPTKFTIASSMADRKDDSNTSNIKREPKLPGSKIQIQTKDIAIKDYNSANKSNIEVIPTKSEPSNTPNSIYHRLRDTYGGFQKATQINKNGTLSSYEAMKNNAINSCSTSNNSMQKSVDDGLVDTPDHSESEMNKKPMKSTINNDKDKEEQYSNTPSDVISVSSDDSSYSDDDSEASYQPDNSQNDIDAIDLTIDDTYNMPTSTTPMNMGDIHSVDQVTQRVGVAPTFPNITMHYWSVKSLWRSGRSNIDYNDFTLDKGQSNPNWPIPITTNKSSSKNSKDDHHYDLDDDYEKRRKAREAKKPKRRKSSKRKKRTSKKSSYRKKVKSE